MGWGVGVVSSLYANELTSWLLFFFSLSLVSVTGTPAQTVCQGGGYRVMLSWNSHVTFSPTLLTGADKLRIAMHR